MKRCHSPSRSPRIAVRLLAVLVLFSFLAAFLAAVAGAQESGAPASLKSQSGDAVDVSTFLQLSRADQAAFLLGAQDAPAIYADEYLRHSSFSAGDADLAQQQKIAERYFSKNPASPNRNRISFVKFLKSHGVDLAMKGDITGYEYGVVTVSNGVVPVQALAKKFRFVVAEDNQIYLVSLTDTHQKLHSFSGSVRVVGDSMHLDTGMLDGQQVQGARDIHIDADSVVHVTTTVIGPLVFAGRTSIALLPSSSAGVRVRVEPGARLENLPYTLGGTFTLLSGFDATKILSVAPRDTGVVNGYTLRGLDTPVQIFLTKEMSGVFPNALNALYFDPQSAEVTFTAAPDAVSPFEVEIDPLALSQNGYAVFFADKNKYWKGMAVQPGSPAYKNILALQQIVGVEPTGAFDEKTRAALVGWQNAYNQRNKLTAADAGWLAPDGAWGGDDRGAFLKELHQWSRLTFRPKAGSRVSVSEKNAVLDIRMKGPAEFIIGNEQYENTFQGILKKNRPSNFITPTPLMITSFDEEGNEVGRISRLGANYLAGNAVTKGMIEGELCVPCFMQSKFDMSQRVCARFVRHTALAVGGAYNRYGPGQTTFDEYIGATGDAWTMSHNIREQGGATLFWKDEKNLPLGPFRSREGLDEQVDYSNEHLQVGDVVGMYSATSGFSSDASLYGRDGRRNSHIAFVLGTKQEAFDYAGDSLRGFLEKELAVHHPVLLGNYPVWVKPKEAPAGSFEKIYLASDGNYYRETDFLGGRKQRSDAEPVTLRRGDTVMVEKVIISHLYNKARQEDLNYFLDHNQRFSLYEHLRPNQQRLREARGLRPDIKVIQQTTENLEDELRRQGTPEHKVPVLAARIRRENNIPNPEKGDILLVSRGSNYDESRQ